MFKPKGSLCQSCGMPLVRDPEGGGTEADGTRSTEYCSKCYVDGAFFAPDMTAAEMQTLVFDKLREIRVPAFLARRFARDIPELRRWKPSN